MVEGKKPLTATDLAAYQHLSCDLYLHNVYHRRQALHTASASAGPSGLSKAQFKRGLDWEAFLFSWLDQSNLLLKVPSKPLEADSLLENILADERSHFFISGLTFWPPRQELDQRFAREGSEPLTFGLAKPDLLEITKCGSQLQWRVIDAKASKHFKASHHIQIYFYTLSLNYLLRHAPYQSTDMAGVWLSTDGDLDASPSINRIKTISISLLAPIMDALLFKELPKIIRLPYHDVRWHYNPLCRGCRYEPECRLRALNNGEIGSIPNISIEDAKLLKNLLRVSRVSARVSSPSQDRLPDIEELHKLFEDPAHLGRFPAVFKKAKQMLGIPEEVSSIQRSVRSPVLEACRHQEIHVIPRRNCTCPRKEDIAIIISAIADPSSLRSGGDYFSVTGHSENPQITPLPAFVCSSRELIARLAEVIRSSASAHTCQFYVWSNVEHSALQNTIIREALTTSTPGEDVQLCVGALSQGASLLQTTFQPLLLSGALLSFLSNGKHTKAEFKAYLGRMGLATDGTVQTLRKRIENELQRLQQASGIAQPDGHHRELAQLPRVVVLKKEIEKQLALPIPGYWDLPECCRLFSPMSPACPSDEHIFTTYKSFADDAALEELMLRRNRMIYQVLIAFRTRATTPNGTSYLVNEAKQLSVQFMDVCKEEHIRKLFFMQQFEVLAKLTELWHSRIDGCPNAPILEFRHVVQGSRGIELVFKLESGILDTSPSDRDYPIFDKLLVSATPTVADHVDNLPVEALFDDLKVCGLVFPLSAQSKTEWDKQDQRVQQELCLADVRNVFLNLDNQSTMVALQIWGTGNLVFREGTKYRLSPRLVDFNTSKVLSALLEIDLLWESEQEANQNDSLHRAVPFIQIITHPESLGRLPAAQQYVRTEGEIQRLFRELRDLGNVSAGSLVLKASQHKAAQHILSNRLSVVWGPPGTGKTYTIALSLLRLIAVERLSSGSQRKIVFITAITYAAIDACRAKLVYLIDTYASMPSLPKSWINNIHIHPVYRGNDQPPPPSTGQDVHVYAGTMYQLYTFAKKNSIEVDCLVVDEAGQIALASSALVIRSLNPQGRIIIAGDTEQLAPILSAKYPSMKSPALFGSILDCLMHSDFITREDAPLSMPPSDNVDASRTAMGSVIQLTENFRMSPDLCEFISTIYQRPLRPQRLHVLRLAEALRFVEDVHEKLSGFPKEVTDPIRTFLIGLSNAMSRKEGENGLLPPVIQPSSALQGTSEFTLPYRPISLAMIRLRSWSKQPQGIQYEDHVQIEAAVAAVLVLFLQACCPDDDIIVATPRRIQREAVKQALAKVTEDDPLYKAFGRMNLGGNKMEHKVRIDTIERLQGSEARFVICLFSVPQSFTADLDFLLDRRRLNVAISRAKTMCILISSDGVLRPPVNLLANEATAKGYAFLKAYEDRAWSYYLPLQGEKVLGILSARQLFE